ncbi:MAG: single-stranded-DNA-specific exonuclease RecJ, partial [Bacillales bacterium]|nr:single-stranded-DNA-specific exonuclease RecJ [Bacillales bacterium]
MDKFLQKLLDYYHLTYDEYLKLNKDINDIRLLDVNTIIDIDTIRNRIQSAIVNKEQILIYGDYDCDGICSTSIVKRTFDILNYPVKYYIPSRYLDGYGLNV